MSYHVIITENILRNFDEIVEINPFDEKTKELLKQYDKKNKTNYFTYLSEITKDYDREKYELYKMISPIFKGLYCNYGSDGLNNVCMVEYENDLKTFKAYIDKNNSDICESLSRYVFNNLGMEEVILMVNKNNKKIINNLVESEYIPMVDDNDKDSYVPLIKEKEDYEISRNSVVCV